MYNSSTVQKTLKQQIFQKTNPTNFMPQFVEWQTLIFIIFFKLPRLSNYLAADDSDDNVLVVGAAPAQDVGALFVALLAQLLNGIIGAERGRERKTQWETRSMQQGNHVKDYWRGASNIVLHSVARFRDAPVSALTVINGHNEWRVFSGVSTILTWTGSHHVSLIS